MNQADTPANQSSPWWQTALRLTVSIGLLALLAYLIDIEQTAGHLWRAHPQWVLLMLGIMMFEVVLSAYKWYVLLHCSDHSVRLGAIIRLVFISDFAGQFLPGTVGRELVRMYGLSRITRDLAMAFSSVLMDRLIGLIGLIFILLLGAYLTPSSPVPGLKILSAGVLVGALVTYGLIMHRTSRKGVDWLLRPKWLGVARDKIQKIYACFDLFHHRPGILTYATVLAMSFNFLRVVVVAVGARALDIDAAFSVYLIVVPTVLLLGTLPISINGLGVREAAIVTMLRHYGVADDAALALSLLCFAMGLISSLPGSVAILMGRVKQKAS